jgi:hypothetical protein
VGGYDTCIMLCLDFYCSYVYYLYTHFVLELRSCVLISLSTLLGFTSVGEVFTLVINTTFYWYIISFVKCPLIKK